MDTDDPSRVDYYTVHNEIPPGGQVDFSYRLGSPLPDRPDGRFETQIQVGSVVEVSRGSQVQYVPHTGLAHSEPSTMVNTVNSTPISAEAAAIRSHRICRVSR